jgi:hypothetical protein
VVRVHAAHVRGALRAERRQPDRPARGARASSTEVTERYGRLRVEHLAPAALLTLAVALSVPGGEVIDLAARLRAGAAGSMVGPPVIDEPRMNGVTTDNKTVRAHSSAGRAADF